MKNDQSYSVLFESVKIGPVTTNNRFYQVPHCCGMGHLRPQAHAAMRSIKAQGGWGVVSTEEAKYIQLQIYLPMLNSVYGMQKIFLHYA